MSAKEHKHSAPPRYDEAFKAGAVRMVIGQGRPGREIRCRTRVVGCFPDGNSVLMLVCAKLHYAADTQ